MRRGALGVCAALALVAPAAASPAALAPGDEATPAAAPAAPVRVTAMHGASLEVAALLLSDRQGGSLPIAVTAFAVPGSSTHESSRVAVALEVQGEPWLAAVPPHGPARLEVSAYLLADDGGVAADALETVELVTPDARARAARGGLRHLLLLPASPGHYTLSLLVRDALRPDLLALRRLAVEVPAPGDTLWVPRAPERGAAWVDGAPERVQELPWGVWPPARAMWEIGEAQELRAEAIVGGTSAGDPDGATPTVELMDAAGVTFALPWLGRPADAGGSVAGKVLPRDVPAGEYQLVVEGASKHARSPAISIVLVDDDPAERAWVEFTLHGEQVPPAAMPATARRLRTSEIASLRQGVERARVALADARPAEAAAALRVAAEAMLTAPEPVSVAALADAVARVLSDGVRQRPERLAPWLAAAVELLLNPTRSRDSATLSAFAAALVRDLAALAEERGVPAEQRELAAQAVFVTALHAGAPRAALRQALTLDPARPALLEAAATDAMARGDFAAAEPWLDRWLALEPSSVAARVRLGELCAQTGRGARAASLWEEARADARARDAWLGALAAQELARRALDEGDAESAVRAARAGLAQFPREEKLTLLLAAALERSGQHAAAAEALVGLAPAGDGEGPRLRFGRLAAEQGAMARAALYAAAERFRHSLAVSTAAPGGPS